VEGSGGETITRQALIAKFSSAVFIGGSEVSYLVMDVSTSNTIAAGSHTLLGHVKYDLKTGETGSFKLVELIPRQPKPTDSNGHRRW
jgi:hypothetical protein